MALRCFLCFLAFFLVRDERLLLLFLRAGDADADRSERLRFLLTLSELGLRLLRSRLDSRRARDALALRLRDGSRRRWRRSRLRLALRLRRSRVFLLRRGLRLRPRDVERLERSTGRRDLLFLFPRSSASLSEEDESSSSSLDESCP